MYRESADPEEGKSAPPRELHFLAVDRAARKGQGMALLQLFGLPVVVGVVASAIFTPTVGLVALLASAALGVWWWRRPASSGFLLTVENGALVVARFRGARPIVTVPLDELRNVSLDIKTIQRVEEGGSAIPAMRVLDSRVGVEVDTSRIVLQGEGPAVPLGDLYIAHMDATEWLGKIRVFLRKNGWVPADERGEDPSDPNLPDPDDDE
ncbi:MAG: hypothetical protein HOO96_19630 [Polyangiaceae bacterium]|nr:hypothetical protein [Polyangiaceae bacterium]